DIPCVRLPDPAWTSEVADEARYIARLCEPCPLLAACRSYALEHHEPVGVWGGLTVTERRQVRKGRAA
ncbi:MAG: WhiB family transcriptional regulator, partial [Actinomycetaceae bacterium]